MQFYLLASSTASQCIQSMSSLKSQQACLLYHETTLCYPVSNNLLDTTQHKEESNLPKLHITICPLGVTSGKEFNTEYKSGKWLATCSLTCWYSFFPNVCLEAARWQRSSSATSARPTALIQWCSLPGPRRPWAISNPLPSPGNRYNDSGEKNKQWIMTELGNEISVLVIHNILQQRSYSFLCIMHLWRNVSK